MDIIWFKTFFLVIIFITGFVAGVIPRRIGLTEAGIKQLTLSNAFSGGVFLGAALLHLLPDAQENFTAYAGDVDFPFPTLVAGLGFILILLLEKAALNVKEEDVASISKQRIVYPIILSFILSIHSIIAGISLGLETTLLSAMALFIAIIAHKGAAAFSLGVSLRENDFSAYRHLIMIATFAIMTPIGLALGTAFSQALTDKNAYAYEALFDALASGTFLYIAVVDIMEDVFKKPKFEWSKVFLIASGFSLMALIAIWA
ncbi:ZIP family transporter [Hydrogenovibrio kuenenii]|uniref:ZIP family transporter n=1 Tax=Hydrogenovibrio kuenenii TaxID=63658 RepID=UPI0004635CA8|nr:ZIP family metal transporter [Hydrogenovibrio kuenenii]